MNTRQILSTAIIATGTMLLASSCMDVKHFDPETGLRDSHKWGKVVEKSIDITDFNAIDLDGNFDIVYTQGHTTSATIIGNENVIAYHKVEVKDSTLVDHTSEDAPDNMPSIRIIVSSTSLRTINLSGAGDIDIKDNLICENLDISLDGAGDIDIESVDCKMFNASISGAGDISIDNMNCTSVNSNVSGAGDIKLDNTVCASDAKLNISGAGDIKADIKCRFIHVEVAGAGDADLNIDCNTITAIASGTGTLELKGHTEILNKNESGLSNIEFEKLEVKNINYE